MALQNSLGLAKHNKLNHNNLNFDAHVLPIKALHYLLLIKTQLTIYYDILCYNKNTIKVALLKNITRIYPRNSSGVSATRIFTIGGHP